jgi:hypothetical protein
LPLPSEKVDRNAELKQNAYYKGSGRLHRRAFCRCRTQERERAENISFLMSSNSLTIFHRAIFYDSLQLDELARLMRKFGDFGMCDFC